MQTVDPMDRGFTVGDGAFETMRSRNGRVFRLASHLRRLEGALGKLQIPMPGDLEERIVAAAEGNGEKVLRLTVTRGPAPMGLAPPPSAVPTVVLLQGPISPPPRELTAIVASGRRNEKALGGGYKLLGYAEGILALLEARRAGALEALFLDTEGHLAEATASNLFLVKGGKVLTPPATCGVLPGVTRDAVFELLPETREEVLVLDDLFQADEAFVTSTVRGVVPLVRVDGRPIGDGRPGPATQRLSHAVQELLDRELGPLA